MTHVDRTFPLVLVLLSALGLILALPASGGAEDPPRADPSAVAKGAPPLPAPSFADEQVAAEYQAAVKLLEDGSYKIAKKAFGRIETENDEQKAAIKRCLLEVKGRLELETIEKGAAKGKVRKALAKLEKSLPKYEGSTLVGGSMREKHDELFGDLFRVVADFEPEGQSRTQGASSRPQGEMRARGRTGYGPNTKFVKEQGQFREGARGLGWKTGRGFGVLTFDEVEEICAEYRYLRISIRCEDPKLRPKLTLIFDTREDPIRGDGGRRGGHRSFYSREGFHHGLVPEAQWQDLRLDLQKDFNAKGDVAWDEVLALRIVHVAGTEGTIFIDDVRLEKE